MGYCINCGAPIPEGSSFCPKCGKSVSQSTSEIPVENDRFTQKPNWHQPPQQKSNNTLVYALVGIIALLLAGGVIFFLMLKSDQEHDQEMAELNRKNELLEKQNELLEEDAKASAKQAEENAMSAKKEESKAKSQKIIIKEGAVHAAEHLAASSGHTPKVVIDGKGVRLRFGPSLSAGYLTDSKGRNKSVPKGKKLKWTGWEDGDWYEVEYLGNYFYVSKQFSYLEY